MRARSTPLALALSLGLAVPTARAGAIGEATLKARLDSAYDDNVYNGRGPDLVHRIAPELRLRLRDLRAQVEAGYQLGYWTYALGKAESSLNHRADVALDARLTRRARLHLGDQLTRAEDPGFVTRVGVVAPQIGITVNVAEARLEVALSRRWALAAAYTFQLAIFDRYAAALADLPRLYDGDEHDAQAALALRASRHLTLHLAGRFQRFDAGPQSEAIARWAVGQAVTPTAGVRLRLTEHLDASAEAGPLIYQALGGAAEVAGAPRTSGLTYRALARLRWSSRWLYATARWVHDVLGATGAGTAIWADGVHLEAGYRRPDRIEASVAAGYFRNGRAVSQPFAYDGITVSALVEWRAHRFLSLGGYYTLRWQETGPGAVPPGATVALFPAITRNVVGLRLTALVGADARPARREVHP